ncbi:diguanylate cyclase (GGDEF) domain-containing protein [Faunimonas pinastri]|uniref:Diguanylate cyclase (GGDEF) domain-containing protein n=1 Tax=Faunimonas pinastri TaxID=1855383 RepID=A0A1H9PD30_9HYPH|nr:diguanylate cyclase (GGDEF) domain-containing protein [Faunimonas pinastri]
MLDRLHVGLLIVDGAGQIISANPAAEYLLSPEKPRGMLLGNLLSACAPVAAEEILRAVENRKSIDSRIIDGPDGRELECRFSPLSDGTGLVSLSEISGEGGRSGRDQLTGLSNREGLMRRLGDAVAQGSDETKPVAVLYLNLDRFHSVNETLGRGMGFALLNKVADRLRAAVSEADMLSRLDADEFAIVQLGREQPEAADALARRLLDLVSRTYVIGGHSVNVSVSIGVALAEPGEDAERLQRRADLALHHAKREGGGVRSFFEPGMNAEVEKKRELEIDLRRALPLKQFHVEYQPQVRLSSGRVVGFEALLRWRHPLRGPVSPSIFIPVAERIGLIGTIGEWVLRTACQSAAPWPADINVAVNVSPLQFRSLDLPEKVVAALAASGLPPSRLELEITEGALLADTAEVLQQLRRIKAEGVRIAMDDFGTGFSSLSYLRKFPFDKIKIDQSFVRSSNHDREAQAIVRAITALGTSLGMTTIAEGVETPEQLARMRTVGCTDVQGYLTGRPLSEGEAAALVARILHVADLAGEDA